MSWWGLHRALLLRYDMQLPSRTLGEGGKHADIETRARQACVSSAGEKEKEAIGIFKIH